MLESGMNGGGEDEVCGAELLDAAEPLELRRIHELDFEPRHFDIAVYGVADEFSPGHRWRDPTSRSYILPDVLELEVAIDSISHTFFDIELERASSPDEVHLVKILSVDGRRFTYELRAPLTEEAVNYIKSLLDAVVFNDSVIEESDGGFEVREPGTRLKKHS